MTGEKESGDAFKHSIGADVVHALESGRSENRRGAGHGRASFRSVAGDSAAGKVSTGGREATSPQPNSRETSGMAGKITQPFRQPPAHEPGHPVKSRTGFVAQRTASEGDDALLGASA